MKEHLFVYGTLQPGQANEHMLSKIGGTWTKASLRGRLMEIGWGANMGFPGLVPDARCAPVSGYIFSSENLQGHWAELDAFEGEEYKRILTPVQLEDGRDHEAFLYVLNLQEIDP